MAALPSALVMASYHRRTRAPRPLCRPRGQRGACFSFTVCFVSAPSGVVFVRCGSGYFFGLSVYLSVCSLSGCRLSVVCDVVRSCQFGWCVLCFLRCLSLVFILRCVQIGVTRKDLFLVLMRFGLVPSWSCFHTMRRGGAYHAGHCKHWFSK